MPKQKRTFQFTPRWKEELVVVGPGGSFILELPMGELTAYLPSEEVWPAVAPEWAVDLWPTLRAELGHWCQDFRARLVISPTATVTALYVPSPAPFAPGERRKMFIALAMGLAIAGLAYLLGSPLLSQSMCLDQGGRWSHGSCEGARPGG